GAGLRPAAGRRVAGIVEPPRPAGIYELLMPAYELTPREQDVPRLILQGAATGQIADELVISVHTVRQHLKSIFGKAGVRSRRDLVAKIFYSHYETRLADNERRTLAGKPVLGGHSTTS